jgi:hypothetical protein
MEHAMAESEERIEKLEHDVRVIKEQGASKLDLAEVKADLSAKLAVTKADILVRLAEVEGQLRSEISEVAAEIGAGESRMKVELAKVENGLRTDIERAKSSLLMWVVTAIFLAQLLPALLKQFGLT